MSSGPICLSEIYHERSPPFNLTQSCGLHSLNNLLGRQVFAAADLEQVRKGLPPLGFGAYRSKIPLVQNWDASVLLATLHSYRLEVIAIDSRLPVDKVYASILSAGRSAIGLLVNVPGAWPGSLVGGRHWLAVRFLFPATSSSSVASSPPPTPATPATPDTVPPVTPVVSSSSSSAGSTPSGTNADAPQAVLLDSSLPAPVLLALKPSLVDWMRSGSVFIVMKGSREPVNVRIVGRRSPADTCAPAPKRSRRDVAFLRALCSQS